MTETHNGAIAFGSGDGHRGSVVLKTKFVSHGQYTNILHSLYLWSTLVVVPTTDRAYLLVF